MQRLTRSSVLVHEVNKAGINSSIPQMGKVSPQSKETCLRPQSWVVGPEHSLGLMTVPPSPRATVPCRCGTWYQLESRRECWRARHLGNECPREAEVPSALELCEPCLRGPVSPWALAWQENKGVPLETAALGTTVTWLFQKWRDPLEPSETPQAPRRRLTVGFGVRGQTPVRSVQPPRGRQLSLPFLFPQAQSRGRTPLGVTRG